MRALALGTAALVLGACAPDAPPAAQADTPPPHNTLSAQEIADGWQLLFDGETTDGWRGWHRSFWERWSER